MSAKGIGSSNKLFQEIMCVVKRKGLITSKLGMSNMPMMVKMIIIAITVTMGVIELSSIQEKNNDKVATTLNERKAIHNA